MSAPTLAQARAAKAEALSAYSRVCEVVGVGITRQGTGYAVKINLARAPGRNATLPTTIDGVPVRVEVVGKLSRR